MTTSDACVAPNNTGTGTCAPAGRRMTPRENLQAVLEGEQPEYIPLVVYYDHKNTDPKYAELFERGLSTTARVSTMLNRNNEYEEKVTEEIKNGNRITTYTTETPLGIISAVNLNGWPHEYYLKSPNDYRILEYVVRHNQYEPYENAFFENEKKIGNKGVTFLRCLMLPMQTMLVQYAGMEQFSFHLMEGYRELFSLAEALEDQLLEYCRLLAKGPGRYVSMMDNLSSEVWGPERFEKYHVPVYQKVTSILHAGNKKLSVHCDGRLKDISGLLSQTGIDIIESLTTPPEGDMTFAEARHAWPGKVFLGNVNVGHYSEPAEVLKKSVQQLAWEGSSNGRNIALEISEHFPENWQECLPIIMESLRELKWQ